MDSTKQGGRFRTTPESQELAEWEDIHAGARAHHGVLSTEINHAVDEDAVLAHHVFTGADALVDYFATTATQHLSGMTEIATPQLHLVRGLDIPSPAREAIEPKSSSVHAVGAEYSVVGVDQVEHGPMLKARASNLVLPYLRFDAVRGAKTCAVR